LYFTIAVKFSNYPKRVEEKSRYLALPLLSIFDEAYLRVNLDFPSIMEFNLYKTDSFYFIEINDDVEFEMSSVIFKKYTP
jgi:hypothetical protein